MRCSFSARGVLATACLATLLFGSQREARAAQVQLDARSEAAFTSFDQWLARSAAARATTAAPNRALPTDAAASAVVAEGVALAKERRRVLLQLAKSDPRQALQRALRPEAVKRLPAAVREQTENYIDACSAQYKVKITSDFSNPAAPVSTVERFVSVGGRTYGASVFGQRLNTSSKAIHANGIIVGDTAVLYDTPLRRMDAEEAAIDPAVRAQCGGVIGRGCIAAKVGAQTLVFRSEAQLLAHEQALQQDEATLGHHHMATREQALVPLTTGDSSAYTTGLKKVLYIRVKYQNDSSDPLDTATVQSTMNTVGRFFNEASYGRVTFETTIPPTFVLPANRPNRVPNLERTATEAARLGGYDIADYDRFIVAYRRPSNSTGYAYIGEPGAYLPSSFSVGTHIHELGHTFGLRHANSHGGTGFDHTTTFDIEYGNPYDTMGRNKRGHFNSGYKDELHWLLPTEYTTVTRDGVYRIEALDDPAALGQRALKINKVGALNYWIEFRRQFTEDVRASNGIIALWDRDGVREVEDNQYLGTYVVGRTLSDPFHNIHITPLSRSGTPATMDVMVKFGAFPGNAAPTGTLAASASRILLGGQVTLQATASDPNGDALVYYWDLGENIASTNTASITAQWPTAGVKQVRCVVSDMMGGTVTLTASITVDPAFTVSGAITLNGAPFGGSTVTLGSRSVPVTASGAFLGNYSFTYTPNGTYTVTPTLAGYSFTPASRTVRVNGANVGGVDFAATRQ